MAVSWTEAHQADGSLTVEVDNLPEIREAVAQGQLGKTHLCLWEGADLKARYVVTGANPSRGGIQITARNLSVLLGSGADGPTIVDREFVAGTNKLSDPGFELFGADALDPLHWKAIADAPAAGYEEVDPEGIDAPESWWNFTGSPYTGTYAAVMLYLPTDDDKLISVDTFEIPYPSTLEVSAMIARGATPSPGRIRLRLVYEGLFRHRNQFVTQAATLDKGGPSAHGDIVLTNNNSRVRIETQHRQLISSPSFGSTLAGWYQTDGTWTAAVGPDGYVARTTPVASPDPKWLTADPSAYPTEWFNAEEGEEFFFDGWIGQEAGVTGVAVIKCLVSCFPADPTKPDYWVEAGFNGPTADLGWYYHNVTFTIPEGYNLISPQLHTEGHTSGGAWLFDNVHLWRTRGNSDTFTGPRITLQPKRRYRWRAPFTSEGNVTGTVQLRGVCRAAGRPPVTLEGSTLAAVEEGEEGQVFLAPDWDFEMPSGYSSFEWQIWSQDVYDGAYYVGKGSLKDLDPTTYAIDVASPGAPYDGEVRPWALTIGQAATPKGAKKVHLEVIAEAGAAFYTVDDVSVRRVDAGPTPATTVLAELLKDPHTGLPIINPGTLHPAGNLSYDWRIRNTVLRDAITTLCTTGQVNPPLEWRVNPDRTVDAGTQTQLYTDHDDVILTRHQIRVLSPLEGSSTVEGVVDEVRIIGAERTDANGRTQTITAEGSLPTPSTTDAFGRPLRQTRTVTASDVDSYEYAALRTSFELALAQPTAPSVTVEISDPRAWGTFEPGDWVYVYDRDANLYDDTNEMIDPETGDTVWPMRLRVVDRTNTYTRGNRTLEIVPAASEAGEGLDITDAVRWSPSTTQRLTLGVRKPEFLTNPAGGNALTQLRRLLASSPR
jgi:hypothetical protein